MLYEERRVIVRRGAFREYRELVHGTLWPALDVFGSENTIDGF